MCHQGNMNCMFSWCISYCKTRDEQLDFLYPNKDDVTRYLKLHNLEQFFQFFYNCLHQSQKRTGELQEAGLDLSAVLFYIRFLVADRKFHLFSRLSLIIILLLLTASTSCHP